MSDRDALAQLNEHLARFFQHADALLAEWQAYGDQLRQTIDAEASRLRETVAGAMNEAGREAAEHIDMEKALGASLARLRREVDRLAQLTGQSADEVERRQGALAGKLTVAGLISANLLLAALLALGVRQCTLEQRAAEQNAVTAPAPAPTDAAPPDAAPPDAAPADAAPADAGPADAAPEKPARKRRGKGKK